jgi:tetratricopeptide (TPR) repeat protein
MIKRLSNNLTAYFLKMNKLVFFISFILVSQLSYAQDDDKKTVTEIFNKIVLAYGSPKSAPQLQFSEAEIATPAIYYASPNARIVVDLRFFKICKSIKGYERDAMAVVISHELAHYYNDHTFCSDFAFAIRDNPQLSGRLKQLSKSEKIALETEADLNGLFYATSAGYNPFAIYEQLLEAIYTEYKLNDNVEGYPSKKERIAIHSKAQEKIAQLYIVFLQGIDAGISGDYTTAIEKFKTLNRYFPSRENYNNIGVFYTYQALSMYPISRAAYKNPERFRYPLKIEKESRLILEPKTRSNGLEVQETIKEALLKAQKAFEKSIALDPNYYNSYMNLACVYDLLDNPEAALGKLNELPKELQNQKRSKRIKAIAYYHMGLNERAEKLWGEVGL